MDIKTFVFLVYRNNQILFLCFLTSMVLLAPQYLQSQKPYEGKSILGVFAHPDDESTVAPILAKYNSEGAKVYLLIVTDGRYGTNEFHNYKQGLGLVAIRKEEMKCAANKLGAELIHLDYHDQLRAAEGYDGHVPHARAMLLDLKNIVEKLQPDVLITWGPDGGSTHMDHRLVGATVTQVFLSKEWERPMTLFYYGTPIENIDNPDSKVLRGQAKKYLRTKVSFSTEDLDRAYNSFQCHYSQIDPKMTREDFINQRVQNGMFVYLRKFQAPTSDSDSVFN